MHNSACRLCGAETTAVFRLAGFEDIEFTYLKCGNCSSLQTQEPTWLKKAYARSNLALSDTGAARRVLLNHAFVLIAAKMFGIRTVLDFGGGDGLFCRLLRDCGIDAHTFDDYAKATYAGFFEGDLRREYDLITAFEVLEHLPNPRSCLDRVFEGKPQMIIASTEIYSGQDATWFYLAPVQGQHVFFYSSEAFRWIASRYQYTFYEVNGRQILSREKLGKMELKMFSWISSGLFFRLFRASLPFSETWTPIFRDYNLALEARKKSAQ
jgi:2-polyprenyl-3-methyl-5-hydroxy-6-metoxy-1,4-benzoquinol methylase